MAKVALEGLEFFAHHGVYEEERQKGNDFVVDVYAEANLDSAIASDDVRDTVDYEVIYDCIAKEMKIPSNLLENVGGRICQSIITTLPAVTKVTVKVYKLHPPIQGKCKSSSVEIFKQRQ